MGTVMNGKKWAGACVNGKTVSGLVKNGVVFYRKPVSTYRRRIMVGDNLSNRTIFQDFPDGFYKSGMSDGEQFNLIESNNINIYEYYNGGSYNVYCGNRTDSNLLYRYDLVFGRTMTKKDVTTGTYLNATVTEVNENKTYNPKCDICKIFSHNIFSSGYFADNQTCRFTFRFAVNATV